MSSIRSFAQTDTKGTLGNVPQRKLRDDVQSGDIERPLRAFIKQKQRPPEKLFSEQRSATDWARGANTSARRRIGAAKLKKHPRNTLPASKSGVLVLGPTATGEFQPHLKEFGFRPVHFERLLRRVFILIQLRGFGILVKFFRHTISMV